MVTIVSGNRFHGRGGGGGGGGGVHGRKVGTAAGGFAGVTWGDRLGHAGSWGPEDGSCHYLNTDGGQRAYRHRPSLKRRQSSTEGSRPRGLAGGWPNGGCPAHVTGSGNHPKMGLLGLHGH